MPKTVKPLHNYLVIEKVEDKDVSAGGIHLIRAPKNQPCVAKVLAVGPGVYDDDEEVFRESGIEVGDYVAYLKPYAKTFDIDNEDIVMLKYQGVLGKVKRWFSDISS